MKKNKRTNKSSSMISVYTMYPSLSACVPSFNLLGITVPEKSVTKNLTFENWRERKMKKATNKQQPDSGIHDTSVYQVSTF